MTDIYERHPEPVDDAGFEPGCLSHLVAGNSGRLLDPRRTPVTITRIDSATGMFELRIDGFEDRGATWLIPLERVNRYQFAKGSRRADADAVHQYRRAVERFDRPLRIEINTDAARTTMARLQAMQHEAEQWLHAHSRFLREGGALPDPEARRGDSRLFDDVQRYMQTHRVEQIESGFARQFVSNPHSGELVKGHRIVLAELGLAAFDGTVVRDEGLFNRPWSKAQRAEHVLHRLAFARALFRALDRRTLTLYRGMYCDEPLCPPGPTTFVSATASIDVARSHFEADEQLNAAMLRQHVPIERVFMTFYETRAMNEQFREAEVVLLHEPGNTMF